MISRSNRLVAVRHQHAGQQLFLAVVVGGVADGALVLGQLVVQQQGVVPCERPACAACGRGLWLSVGVSVRRRLTRTTFIARILRFGAVPMPRGTRPDQHEGRDVVAESPARAGPRSSSTIPPALAPRRRRRVSRLRGAALSRTRALPGGRGVRAAGARARAHLDRRGSRCSAAFLAAAVGSAGAGLGRGARSRWGSARLGRPRRSVPRPRRLRPSPSAHSTGSRPVDCMRGIGAPTSASIASTARRSSGVASVKACPVSPARPVRPMRWT